MPHDYDSNYGLVYKDEFDLAESKGYELRSPSTDDNWRMLCNHDKDTFDWITFREDKLPNYMVKLGVKKCCIDHKLAFKIASVLTLTKGGSDGYGHTDEVGMS